MFRLNVIPDNSLIQSTFKITYGQGTGTCFQYVHLEGQVANVFLVTVRHLFPNIRRTGDNWNHYGQRTESSDWNDLLSFDCNS